MRYRSLGLCLITLLFATIALPAFGQNIVIPGTGQKVDKVGDTFEDDTWTYQFAAPKSSENIDKKKAKETYNALIALSIELNRRYIRHYTEYLGRES